MMFEKAPYRAREVEWKVRHRCIAKQPRRLGLSGDGGRGEHDRRSGPLSEDFVDYRSGRERLSNRHGMNPEVMRLGPPAVEPEPGPRVHEVLAAQQSHQQKPGEPE